MVDELFPKLSIGKLYDFSSSQKENSKFLTEGWSTPEDWGTWSNGKDAEILFPEFVYTARQIYLKINIYNPNNERKIIFVTLNNEKPLEIYLSDNLPQTLALSIPDRSSHQESQFLRIKFHVPQVVSPASIGKGSDQRDLGVGIISATIK